MKHLSIALITIAMIAADVIADLTTMNDEGDNQGWDTFAGVTWALALAWFAYDTVREHNRVR